MPMINDKKKFKFVVLGGGTAGVISATWIKKYWGEFVDVVLIYDHKNPNIGIGESLTPIIYRYLNYIGVTREELIKNVNCTVKLGLKFKNWLENEEYYHSFFDNNSNLEDPFNFSFSYEIATEQYNHNTCYGKDFFENNRIPRNPLDNQSLHIDGQKFSQYILDKFKDSITILDDIILDISKDESFNINFLIGEKNKKIEGDFFIDASGLNKTLFNKLNSKWVDKSDWLPLDRCIPCPVPFKHSKIPPYTTSEATANGWILQVPLKNRWGVGYLFSSKFTKNEEAIDKFSIFLKEKFSVSLESKKIIHFNSGYWEEQWIGNCLSVGLSSGFTEPLEATNIHHVIHQIEMFINKFNFKIFDFDRKNYNEKMLDFYDRVYLFLRFCYSTNRNDSPFWKYITSTKPKEIIDLENKLSLDILNYESMDPNIFNSINFIQIAQGLKKIDKKSYEANLYLRNAFEYSKNLHEHLNNLKKNSYDNSIDHLEFVKSVE